MLPLISSRVPYPVSGSRSLLPLAILFLMPVLILCVFSDVRAQGAATKSTSGERPDTASETKAFDLLDSLAERIATLRAPENRIYMECAVADMLWARDENRARALFETVTKDVAALVSSIDLTDQQQSYNTISLVSGIRQEVVSRLASRDPELALTFLRATRMPSSDSRARAFQDDGNLELQLAAQIAGNDLQRALRIARSRLSGGLSYQLVSLLSQVYSKDRAAARELHKDIVDRLRDENFQRNDETFNSAWNLVSAFQPPQANEETYQQLIEVLTDAALAVVPGASSNNLAQNLYRQVQAYLPQITKYAPGRANALQQWSQRVERTFDPTSRMYLELNRINQNNGTVEDIIALAQKYPPEVQVQLYHQAAWKALSSGNSDRARQIASDYITDPTQRAQILSQIENQLLWNNVNQNKLAETRQMLRNMRDPYQRVQILNQMAANLVSAGDKKGALDLMNEARGIVLSSPPGLNKLQAQMELVRGFVTLDFDQSVALMQTVIAQMNELIAAGAVLDGFENHYLQDGEWVRRGNNGLSNLVNTMDQQLGLLAAQLPVAAASSDSAANGASDNTGAGANARAPAGTQAFDRAYALAEQLERPEVRLMAHLDIVQAVLAPRMRSTLPIIHGRVIRSLSNF